MHAAFSKTVKQRRPFAPKIFRRGSELRSEKKKGIDCQSENERLVFSPRLRLVDKCTAVYPQKQMRSTELCIGGGEGTFVLHLNESPKDTRTKHR